ncbi:hypothetical protein RGQ29_024604 [Quercus rubra]|uniref:AAA+ ATPase domain-containing protein n=1 Tax=Quercus rubra TaxID=3512 RepID=A0AAN7IKR0_QUERU|nr:hypothetical protein RGQ29_024604 [Quercus rubra]
MDTAVSVIVAIGGCFVGPIKKHCGYLIHYKSNITDLDVNLQKLNVRRERVLLEICEAESNGQVIDPEVNTWVRRVDNLLEDAAANVMSLVGRFPNTKSRYSLSRKAKKKTLEIGGLLSDAALFVTRVSYNPPPLGIGSSSIEVIMDFESRTKMTKDVLEALKTDKVNMIAICGMGGIGKTTMANEVARAVDGKLFDKVVMAVVSQNRDLSKIQGQIADMLNLELKRESEVERARQLYSRLENIDSVLVILDDVWDALDLNDVGIPYGGQQNKCKILLTSRSQEACTQMKSQKIFPIKVLSEEEAWNLFRQMAGDCVKTPSLHPIAKKVAKECGGLPVVIVTVGRALENKCEFEWRDALQQLKNARSKNIPGLDSKVYSRIKLSYSYLESNEAKSCFLLCCLFPEDSSIPIEHLVRYAVGQRLFEYVDTMAKARNRVHAIVKNLKRSFLLLDSEEGEQFVKMHDVVRDVAISIAENDGFLVRSNEIMEEWPEKDSCERSTAISLIVSMELKKQPDVLECPKLELLQLTSKIKNWYEHLPQLSPPLPPNLFKGMNGLKVLSLFGMPYLSLPQSIKALQNLRTLQFVHCGITDVSAIGGLGKLEILSFLGSGIEELPGEMRNLSCLKLLELTGCNDLKRIPPDLLSSLYHLEELYMVGVDVKWKRMEEEEVDEEEKEEEVDEEEEEEKKGANASLTELESLFNLVLPKGLRFRKEWIKFQIIASGIGDLNYLFENSLELASCDLSDIAKRQMLLQLLKRSEILRLEEIKDLKNIAYELDKEGFQCLKVLEVVGSEDVEYVMDATSYLTPRAAFPILESLELEGLTNLKEIYSQLTQFPDRSSSGACFGSLKSLRLRTLPILTGFCTSVGPVELVQPSLNQEIFVPNFYCKTACELQSIEIEECDAIENIFQRDGEEEATDIILFPRVSSLKLHELPNMMSFCIKAYSFEWSSIKKISLRNCPKLKTIGSEIQSPIKSKKINRELDSRPSEHELGSPGFLWRCLECVPRHKNYGLMAVSDQGTTNKSQRRYSVKKEGTLGKPNDPKVGDSNNPSEIWSLFPSHIIECLKNLESIKLMNFPSLEVLFQLEELNVEESHVASVLDQLRILNLYGLDNLMHIWKKGLERILGFGNMRFLNVDKCNSLTYLFSPSIAKLLVMLESIIVFDCEKIEEILARAGEEEEEKDVLFHKVNHICLWGLPRLKYFCPETNAF